MTLKQQSTTNIFPRIRLWTRISTQVLNHPATRSTTPFTLALNTISSRVLVTLVVVHTLTRSVVCDGGGHVGGSDDNPRGSGPGLVPTPTPEDYFTVQPSNASVPQGDFTVMKCKTTEMVHYCRWFYIEKHRSFYDEVSQAKMVKEFKPTNDNDCSIRFTAVRKIQEGQWLCQARRFMSQNYFNTRPAFLTVVAAEDERAYNDRNNRGGQHDNNSTTQTTQGSSSSEDENRRTRDPTAPTAIPALNPSATGPLLPPLPPPGSGEFRPHQGPTRNKPEEEDVRPRFLFALDDHIQNTWTGLRATLPCQVDRPVSTCKWIMPNGALYVWDEGNSSVGRSSSVNTPAEEGGGGPREPPRDYEFVGNRGAGNCSLRVHSVKQHDEGNWRCVVSIPKLRPKVPGVHPAYAPAAPKPDLEVEAQGPLIHLHLLDYPHDVQRTDTTSKPVTTHGTNITLIVLFVVGLILFIIGIIIIYCCYKRVWSRSEVGNRTNKILDASPTSSNAADYTQQWFQGRNLKIVDPNFTDDFKLKSVGGDYKLRNVDAMNLKNAHVKYSDLDHYNQYVRMSQAGQGSNRSSASSNTTMTTVAADPSGRDRSVSFVTSPEMSPTNLNAGIMRHCGQDFRNSGHMVTPSRVIIPQSPQDEMANVSFYEVHRKLQRPVSLYSTGHVYEEIQDKLVCNHLGQQHVINSQGVLVPVQGFLPPGPLASTPVYTNVVEDHDGYLIPSKSAKIVNSPTREDEPTQYLPMKGDLSESEQRMLSEMQFRQHMHKMNDLSMSPMPTIHMQIHDPQHIINNSTSTNALENNPSRRYSNGSQLSQENNLAEEKLGDHQVPSDSHHTAELQDPNLNTSTKQNVYKTTVTPPNANKRQKMPLPCQPKTPSGITKSPPKVQLSSVHQRTTSLPDTSNATLGTKISHAKSPSLVPTPENYDVPRSVGDVPRSLDAVPRSVNGSDISLDDIDGTIV